MPRNVIILLSAAVITGCSSGTKQDSDSSLETDTDTDTASGPDDDFEPFVSDFQHGKFRFTKLTLVTQSDTDGDGEVDNNLPNALTAVDLVLQTDDMSPTAVNDNFKFNLDNWITNILLEATHDGAGGMTIGLFQGTADANFNLTVNASSVDSNGNAKETLEGYFTANDLFFAGPGQITVPVTFVLDDPPLPVKMQSAYIEGQVDNDGAVGTLTGGLPIEDLINDVVAPLVPDSYDINGDGVYETKQDILDLIWDIAPLAADLDLDDDGTGDAISCKFTWTANPQDWPDP